MARRSRSTEPIPAPFRLSRERQQELRRVLRQIHERLPILDAAEACGLECQEARDDLAYRRGQIEDILAQLGTAEFRDG